MHICKPDPKYAECLENGKKSFGFDMLLLAFLGASIRKYRGLFSGSGSEQMLNPFGHELRPNPT
jgi:hypothetical protein